MNKVLKITIVLVVIAVLVGNFVYAVDTTNEGKVITLTNTENVENNTNVNNVVNDVNDVNDVNVTSNVNNTTSVYNNTATNTSNLPKTGIDSSIMIFIVLGLVSAVYSYKKSLDYKANS